MPAIVKASNFDEGITFLSKALGKLPMPSRRRNRDILKDPWRQQISHYSSLYPGAAMILKSVSLPRNIANQARIRRFVESTTITPDGQAFPPQCTEILPRRLWIADGYAGTDTLTASRLGVTHVVCFGEKGYHKICPLVSYMEHAIMQTPDLDKLYDSHLVPTIDDAVTYIRDILHESTKNRVLLHCARGVEWSPAITVCLLMDLLGCSFQHAYDIVRKKRSVVSLPVMIQKAVQEWWTLEELRHDLPPGRGYRRFKWARKDTLNSEQLQPTKENRSNIL